MTTAAEYAELATSVREILTSEGQTVTLHQNAIAKQNLSTGVTDTGTPVNTDGVGVSLDYTGNQHGESVRMNSRGFSVSKRLYLSIDVAPRMEDTITVDEEEYIIKNVKTLNPAGVVLLYDLWIVQ